MSRGAAEHYPAARQPMRNPQTIERTIRLRRLGTSYREIGEIVDIAPSTARNIWLRYGRAKTRDDILGLLPPPPSGDRLLPRSAVDDAIEFLTGRSFATIRQAEIAARDAGHSFSYSVIGAAMRHMGADSPRARARRDYRNPDGNMRRRLLRLARDASVAHKTGKFDGRALPSEELNEITKPRMKSTTRALILLWHSGVPAPSIAWVLNEMYGTIHTEASIYTAKSRLQLPGRASRVDMVEGSGRKDWDAIQEVASSLLDEGASYDDVAKYYGMSVRQLRDGLGARS